MKNLPLPAHEEERLQALNSYQILDTLPEKQFDDITRLASIICKTPIALVGLIDGTRQWYKSIIGLDGTETERELTFCQHAIMQKEIMHVPDAMKDKRFADSPFVTGEPYVRFYAGAPLTTADGYNLGTLCIIDSVPRIMDDNTALALRILADQVMSQLELRKQTMQLEREKRNSDYTKNVLQSLIDKTAQVITLKDTKGVIQLGNAFYNAQAKPGATVFARGIIARLVEAVEDG